MDWKNTAKNSVWLAVIVVITQALLSGFVYPNIPGVSATSNIFSISPATALASPVIGDKVIGFLTGIVPFSLGSFGTWISLIIGVFVLLLFGMFIFSLKFMPHGKNIYQKLALILLYGTAGLYAVLLLTKFSAVSTLGIPMLLGVLINYAIVTVVVVGISKTKFGRNLIKI